MIENIVLRTLAMGKLSVLLFHKVPNTRHPLFPGDLDFNDFVRTIDFLQEEFNILPLSDAVARLGRGRLPSLAACITFDDGYTEWENGVVSLLHSRGLPATFFVTAGQFMGTPMWNERILYGLANCSIELRMLELSFLPSPLSLEGIGARQRAVAIIERALKYQSTRRREEMLCELESVLRVQMSDTPCMTREQLRTLENKGFEVGAHTIGHPILQCCNEKEAIEEIGASREILAGITGSAIRSFAYPNGYPERDFSSDHVKMVKRAGYSYAVTTGTGAAHTHSSPFQIPRFTPWGPTSKRRALQIARNILTRPRFLLEDDLQNTSTSSINQTNIETPTARVSIGPPLAPLISVVTAVYNGAAYIEETIKSILEQTVSNFEYIIVDDASTDDSVDRIMQFRDPRIKLLRNATNNRLVKTRNRGLDLAVGRYIALIDHDDVAELNRFEVQIDFLENNHEFVLVGCLADNIDESGRLLGKRVIRRDSPEQLRVRLLFRNSFVNSTLLYRNISGSPIRYRTEFPLSEDYDFIVRMSALGKIYIIPQQLMKYRLHANNYSNAASREMLNYGREVKRNQLDKLGLSYSENELLLHAGLEHLSLPLEISTLSSASAWMAKLINSNDKNNIYTQKAFNSIVFDELCTLGEHASKSGHVNFSAYSTPEYFDALKANPMAALRISAKLALGYVRSWC